MQSKMCSQTNRFFLIWVTLVYRCSVVVSFVITVFSDATADAVASVLRWTRFFPYLFPLHFTKTPFKCIVFIQLEYCFHFDYLVPQPPHPSTSSIPTVRWNDIQKYSTSTDKNKSAVKMLYWPPHPAFLDSLRQFTPAPSCPVQARKYNNTQRERETGGNSLLSILTKSLYKSETTARSVQHIVTL